ncbi:MAG TPA: hypothetical protein VFU15_01800 [Bacteroidia bacterium]|nr:hypothetical protein [Bacteroidia bacterium]
MIFLFLLFPYSAFAQMFLPVDDDPFGVPVKFNPDSVRHHKIKSITCSLQYKPDEHIIEDKGLKEYYQFDSLGRMEFYWRTRVHDYSQRAVDHPAVYRHGRMVARAYTEYKYMYTYDTIFVNYYYDNYQRLVCRRECDGDYYHTWYYIYNTDGTISRQTHCRESNVGLGHANFRLGVQTIISQEDFSYQKFSSTQIKQLCLNDEGKPYKTTMMILDEKGRPLDIREEYMSGGVRIVTTWKYDSLDRTSGYTYTSNAGSEFTENIQYNYDSLGRMASVMRYQDGNLKDEFNYLYNGNSQVAYAYINRRHIEKAIDIVKMEVVYWG